MNAVDRQNLISFVDSAREVLDWAVENAEVLLSKKFNDLLLLGLLREAWSSVGNDFNQVRDAIGGRQFDDQLDAVGLSGAQLTFKLEVFERVYNPFASRVMKKPDFVMPKVPRPFRFILRWFSWLLGVINAIFKSIVAATGFGDAVEEFKSMIEKMIDGEDLADEQLGED